VIYFRCLSRDFAVRPAEYTAEEIIAAGEAIRAVGRNVTGFALRQRVGGGNPSRLRQVWDEHLADKAVAVEPVAELPVEVAETVAAVTKALAERIAAFAVKLNDTAVRAAERRVTEVVRTAGEQCAQAERELADAAQTVDDLEVSAPRTPSLRSPV
jgi:colicin import membrane protein